MIIAIRHFSDRKRPCLVLEEGNQAVVLGYLTDREREEWLRRAFNIAESEYQWALNCPTKDNLETIITAESEDKE